MADIFLSYASEDRERVRPLVAVLEEHGWDVWWDRDIPPGMTWTKMIEQALADTRAMVAVWTNSSIQSEWVQIEATKGKASGPFVPVLLDDVAPPLAFTLVQSANLIAWDGSETHAELKTVIQQLKIALGQAAEPELLRLPWADLLDGIERGVLVGERVQVGPRVISDDPDAFVRELYAKWVDRYPSGWPSVAPEFPEDVVYISYAEEDLEWAQRLKEALEDRMVPAWHWPRDQLRGPEWNHALRRDIRKAALFVPLISMNVLTSDERYFRREWYEAEQRQQMQPPNMPFIVPIPVDETDVLSDGIPDQWRRIQWLPSLQEDEDSALDSLEGAYKQVQSRRGAQ